MKRIIIFFVLFFNFIVYCYAVPAYPRKIKIATANSYTYITLHGDEHCKWAVTEDNYTLLSDSLGWVYAQEDDNGYACFSEYRLTDPKEKIKPFLASLKKNIRLKKSPENNQIKQSAPPTTDRHLTTGDKQILVILMQFPDFHFQKTFDEINALFNKRNYDEEGAAGSVHDFFDYASYGQLNLECTLIGPYTSRYNMAFYGTNLTIGGNDVAPYALFLEAIEQASQEISLSNFDNDKDGYIDNVHIVFAGYGEESGASANTIWSHEMTFDPITIQNIKINRYSCAPELRDFRGNRISRIGVHCHEIAHTFGITDFYDTDSEKNGIYEGTGDWDIMASGSWNNDGITPANFNPYVKVYNLGWTDAINLPIGENIILQPSNFTKNTIYRIDTPIPDEFYLLENRALSGFDIANPGEGLLIYHIHKDISSMAQQNKINASHPQGCYVVCASQSLSVPTSSNYGNINSAGCPFPGTTNKHDWNSTSVPAVFSWDGVQTDISLSDISLLSNGDIKLNNKITILPDIFWHESFDYSVFPSSWSNKSCSTNNEWKIFHINNNNSSLADAFLPPLPNDGNSYIYLKKTDYQTIIDTCLLISPFLSSKEDIISTLSFYFYIKSFYNKSNNILKIYYKKNIDGDWHLLDSISKTTMYWSEKKISFPDTVTSCQLMFEAIMTSNGSISLDNITIESIPIHTPEYSQSIFSDFLFYDTTRKCFCINDNDSKSVIYIYDMKGHVIVTEKDVPINLQTGIYLVRYKNFISKIFVSQ